MDELLNDFVSETQESLEALASVVVALEADPTDRKLLDELFRFFHTIKGSCGFLNLPRFERLSHAAEDVLSDIRAGEARADPATITAVFAVMDRIALLSEAIITGDSLSDLDDDQLIQTLKLCHKMASLPEAHPVESEMPRVDSATQLVENQSRAGVARTIRLPITLIDQLMNGVSDMVLARNEVARKLRDNMPPPELETAFERLSGCIADMRDTISKTRMQRVERLFVAIPRMVRDLGRELGKTIDLTLEGGDVEMDREMVEMVVDPLTHIIRNSIDHGIETPEQRRAVGKPEAGHLHVSARQSGSQIVIEIADDGRGIDVEAVARKIAAAGLMTAQEAAALSDQAKLELIFTPGLSTAAQVTAVSGRGVGMDIVRANIERIGGMISLQSEPGRGLTISLRVPLTLTIIPGLILNAGGLNFAIPRSAVIEILHDNNATVTISRLGGGVTATIRSTRYSMIDLEDVIGLPKIERAGPRSLMLVRSANGKPYILGVSHVENHEELVVRPAAPVVMAAGIYAGMTLPDNGQPMLLLDAGGIAQAAQLPVTVENVRERDAADEARSQSETYSALRFVELSGEERVIRLSLVERVEDVPFSAFGQTPAHAHVLIDGRLFPCAHEVKADQGSGANAEVTCLRLRDEDREICYPVRDVLDIADVPVQLDMKAAHGVVAGIALIEGAQVEVIDSFALFASLDRDIAPGRAASRYVVADPADSWHREILAPLLVQAGYDVVWDAAALPDGADGVVLISTGRDAPSSPAGRPVVRLRSGTLAEGPDDDSIYRYDRAGLLGAISAACDKRSVA
jgi:two-component system chemotaxis sensor kinase CheA